MLRRRRRARSTSTTSRSSCTTRDFRPDIDPGDQTIDVYTVGFTTDARRERAAPARPRRSGDGEFFNSNNPEELAEAHHRRDQRHRAKSQSLHGRHGAGEPDRGGEQLYSACSCRRRTRRTGGPPEELRLTGAGDILDPTATARSGRPERAPCSLGRVPAARRERRSGTPPPRCRRRQPQALHSCSRTRLAAAEEFTVRRGTPADLASPRRRSASRCRRTRRQATRSARATTADQCAEELDANMRGCEFGTSGTVHLRAAARAARRHLPLEPGRGGLARAVRRRGVLPGCSDHAYRDAPRVVYAGANDGFLHGFDAGTWQPARRRRPTTAAPATELFGFMPWPARQNIRKSRSIRAPATTTTSTARPRWRTSGSTRAHNNGGQGRLGRRGAPCWWAPCARAARRTSRST